MNSRVYTLAKRFRSKYFGTICFRLGAHCRVIANHLNPDEKLYYVFCGQKGGLNKEFFNSCVIALTNERIMVATKRVLWGYFLTNVKPELYNDLKVESGFLFGRILIDTVKEKIAISNLSKASLREVETAITTYSNKYKNKKFDKKEEKKDEKKEESKED